MKEILEKFPKAVLIELLLREGTMYRFESKEYLEGRLLYFQWEQEEKALAREAEALHSELQAVIDCDLLSQLEKLGT